MSDLNAKIEENSTNMKRILIELGKMQRDNRAKEIMDLKLKKNQLLLEQTKILREASFQKYSKCKHILVRTTNESCGCIKCGLDELVLYISRKDLIPYAQNMYDYLKENSIKRIRGKETSVSCDLALARAIYSHIKLVYPKIDDRTATKYFEIALDNIRNIKVSEERQENRAKRLGLNPEFTRWNS